MSRPWRWDPCISHTGADVSQFIETYFAEPERNVLLIGGAGFDPRAREIAQAIAATNVKRSGLFLQEVRPEPSSSLVAKASANMVALQAEFPVHSVEKVDIFGADLAVVGGRNVAKILSKRDLAEFTDVAIDVSALSVGTSFPIIRLLVEKIQKKHNGINLHLFVAHDPSLDAEIKSVPSDSPGYVHGFVGGATLDQNATAAKLWLPQLARGKGQQLGRLHEFISPHDTCPILPFPAKNPRLADELAEEFITELESSWTVDARDIVYADENDPLDLYRTILRLHDLRTPVFEKVGGSVMILSPVGSKVMALGALLAALERDLPVAYLEALEYSFSPNPAESESSSLLMHIWLEGDVYPQTTPQLFNEQTRPR